MALLMVSPMALLMLGMMKQMFPDKKMNMTIAAISIVIFALSLFFLREQIPIGDQQYMQAMIPHHSSAILTSKEADIKDPAVKNLSIEIVEAQEREINLMKRLLET
jgi:uncharacterized protein (DUF305 family)